MSSKYKIPDWIKVQFNREFFELFKANLEAQFCTGIVYTKSYLNQLVGTMGFGRAVQNTFIEINNEDAEFYYKTLDWSDSDMFDWELISIMLAKNNEKECRLGNEIYAQLMKGIGGGDKSANEFEVACFVAAGVIKRICDFVEDFGDIALKCGSEWLYQSDNAQVGAIGLVGDILDDLEAYQEHDDVEETGGVA